jgi:hypothetical protein
MFCRKGICMEKVSAKRKFFELKVTRDSGNKLNSPCFTPFRSLTINYIENKTKCRHLKKLACKETMRQETGDTVSHVSIFDPAL